MTRGRRPLKALEKAFPLAGKRGLVQRYQHRQGNTCDLTVMSPGLVTFATVKRLDRLTVTPEDILYDFAAEIALLRFIVSSPGISRELWLRTPHGAWRFFRVLDDGIIELDRDGKVLENGRGPVKNALPAATGTAKKAGAVPGVRKKPGRKRKDEADKNPALPEHLDADLEPAKKPAVVMEKFAMTPKNLEPAKNSEPAKDPGPEINPVPDLLSQKIPGPEKNLVNTTIPEKFIALAQDSGPAADQTQQSKPEEIPAVIEKFLKRRKKGLEKDPGSE